jgi:predicted nucleotidyltransferase
MQPAIDKADILNRLKDAKPEFARYGVQNIGLFGSFSRSAGRPDSDVDFVVRFKQNSTDFYNFMNLAYYLEDKLNRKIDLLTFDSLPENFKKAVEKEIVYLEV